MKNNPVLLVTQICSGAIAEIAALPFAEEVTAKMGSFDKVKAGLYKVN